VNIGEYSVRTPVIGWLLVVIWCAGGVWGFQAMGKLEDPAFTIKQAKIMTRYPGASAREVYDEVTYHLEEAVQRLPQLKRIKMSVSRPGLSDILIEFKDQYSAEELPNVFDELRRKVNDVRSSCLPGPSHRWSRRFRRRVRCVPHAHRAGIQLARPLRRGR
jgi:multidrug efflux pump subunit AcrB